MKFSVFSIVALATLALASPAPTVEEKHPDKHHDHKHHDHKHHDHKHHDHKHHDHKHHDHKHHDHDHHDKHHPDKHHGHKHHDHKHHDHKHDWDKHLPGKHHPDKHHDHKHHDHKHHDHKHHDHKHHGHKHHDHKHHNRDEHRPDKHHPDKHHPHHPDKCDWDRKKWPAFPWYFTSKYTIYATPGQVVDEHHKKCEGIRCARGVFHYAINSHENIICYDITIKGFKGEYKSPANTATHIHEGKKGKTGPPRIVFPNPVGHGEGPRKSFGCIRGPFKTGVKIHGRDTGDGFHVKEIERDPKDFYTDVHSSVAPAGAIRGQFEKKKKKNWW